MKLRSTLIASATTLCVASAAHAQWTEGFETVAGVSAFPAGNHASPGVPVVLPSGLWHSFNDSTPIGFGGTFQGNPGVFPAQAGSANSYAAMNVLAGDEVATNSVYLMTPVALLNNGDTLSFWTRVFDNPTLLPDRLELRLSTAGASTTPADFSTLMLSVNPSLTSTGYPAVWTQFTGTVSGLGSPTLGRFALRYHVTNSGPQGVNGDFIGIDTVQYTPIPAPGALALLGIAGVVGSGRRRRSMNN